jgi:hypothetical protein
MVITLLITFAFNFLNSYSGFLPSEFQNLAKGCPIRIIELLAQAIIGLYL